MEKGDTFFIDLPTEGSETKVLKWNMMIETRSTALEPSLSGHHPSTILVIGEPKENPKETHVGIYVRKNPLCS